MKQFILSIDQGTTGSRAFIVDDRGRIVASAYQEFKQYYPKPGWVEHDPNEIWQSVVNTIEQAIRQAHIKATQIKGIGITNQRETTVVWNRRTGKPVYQAIVWQCRRTAADCEPYKKHQSQIRQLTGLVVDAYFSATKIKWILNHVKGARKLADQGELCFGTIDSWLIWQLTGGKSHVTDMTNASRTMLFDINKKEWSSSLLALFDVPMSMMPKALPSGSLFGETIKVAGLNANTGIYAVMGDQQSALYGQGCVKPGTMKNTYGTGCFLLLNTGKKRLISKGGLLTTVACDNKGQPVYALEGAVFIAGALVQWLRDELEIIKDSSETGSMALKVNDAGGVVIVPAFVGLGAPYWKPEARGIITGLTRGSNKNHIARAALEAIAYQTKDIVDLMKKESGLRIQRLAVDGGACKNDFLMQFQADILPALIDRPKQVETTALGVAYLAGLTSGLYSTKMLSRLRVQDKIFKPTMSAALRASEYAKWQHAISQCMCIT